jgi:hypothetical protein
MKDCLCPQRLLALTLGESSDDRDCRSHLARCLSCSAAYHEIARDHALIARSLELTARSVMDTPRRKPVSVLPLPDRRGHVRGERQAFLIGLAAAGAGAMAAAFMLMLAGIHAPVMIRNSKVATNTDAQVAPSPASVVHAQGAAAIAAASFYAPWQSNEVIFTDSTDDIGYHEAMAGTSDYQDLFYCDPQGDGTFCSAPAGQG